MLYYFSIDILKELGFDCPISPTEKEIDILFKKTNRLLKTCDILSLPMLEILQKLLLLRILSQLTLQLMVVHLHFFCGLIRL